MSAIVQQVKQQLQSEGFVEKFSEVNRNKLDLQNEVGYAIQLLGKNSLLQQCDKTSILQAVYNASLTGFTLNPTLQQAHLVPRRVKGNWHCFLEPDYKGLITKLIDLGVVLDVYAYVVYENDKFDIELGLEKKLYHKPYYILGNKKGKEIGGYAVAILPDGRKKWEYQPIDYFLGIMEKSESWKSDKRNKTSYSPWNSSFREDMLKKTMIRYIWKTLPKNQRDDRVSKIIELEDKVNSIDFKEESREKAIEAKQTKTTEAIKGITDKMKKKKAESDDSVEYEDIPNEPEQESEAPQDVQEAPEQEQVEQQEEEQQVEDEHLKTLQQQCDERGIKYASNWKAETLEKKIKEHDMNKSAEKTFLGDQGEQEQTETAEPTQAESDNLGALQKLIREIAPDAEDYVLEEPDGGRAFGKIRPIWQLFTKSGITNDQVNAYLAESDLGYKDFNSLFREGSVDELFTAYKELKK